ncbi:ABC transporter ATP-binding protein [Candidimonas humi]|uniref:ABC transporter ATP-binding protein n=1 Tax=Candidimonas humi TaxID=683355 RepID=A0ABV8NVH6_9BURK|nr:ABC transporter ATP-binding protein [Candidimonas humi]MBV6304531.1 ABC transporter ATP-binding protein [Candidimonas humi]
MLTSVLEGNSGSGPAVDDDEPMLALRGVVAGYGGFDILHGVNLEVRKGEIVAIVGPNGSGKSTVFKAIYGLIKIRLGEVSFEGQDVASLGPQDLLKAGIAMVPQLSTIFPSMSVYENLELGMYLVRDKALVKRRIDEILELFPRLAERRAQNAGTLSGGERRALEIGRSLMLKPRMILMDEPSVGLSPILTKNMFEQLQDLQKAAGITFLVIEQNARSALEISDRGYVIQRGVVSHTGTGRALLGDDEVRRSFLGG